MKTQHTPAPWDIFPKEETLEIGNYGVNAPLVRLSATIPTNDWEGWANARLISSAPDLLSALEFLLADYIAIDGHVLNASTYAITKAQDAIRKAKGEA